MGSFKKTIQPEQNLMGFEKAEEEHQQVMNQRLDPKLNFRELLELEEVESKVQSSQMKSKYPDFSVNQEE